VHQVLREQVLDEKRAADERQREHEETSQDALEAAGFERLERREYLEPPERLATAQPAVHDHLRQRQHHADGQESERRDGHRDVEREFPARVSGRELARALRECGLQHGGYEPAARRPCRVCPGAGSSRWR
jgi:hypothetical protein